MTRINRFTFTFCLRFTDAKNNTCSLDVNLTVAAPLYSEMYSAVASLSCQNAWLGWPGPGPLVPQSPCQRCSGLSLSRCPESRVTVE